MSFLVYLNVMFQRQINKIPVKLTGKPCIMVASDVRVEVDSTEKECEQLQGFYELRVSIAPIRSY